MYPLQVPRDYAAFENLQKELLESFPELKLPDLPRKFHLFVNQGDIDERQVAFDCLMKVLAKKKELCTSVPMLRFLGKLHIHDGTVIRMMLHTTILIQYVRNLAGIIIPLRPTSDILAPPSLF